MEVPVERDLFAWLGLGVTISTGFVLAFFAILAYAVQRARYLRDIEPDLRVTYVNVSSMPFGVVCVIENHSEVNRAENVAIAIDINLLKLRVRGRGSASRVLSKDNISIALDFDGSVSDLRPALDSSDLFEREGALRLVMKYSTPSELLLFILNPWGLTRKRYRRKYSGDVPEFGQLTWRPGNLRIF